MKYILLLLLAGCTKIANIKTIDAYKVADLEGLHFSVLYNVIGAPDTNYVDTYSHRNYNYYNYVGYSNGHFYAQEGLSNLGFGMSYSCEIQIKTDKRNILKSVIMTGTNCPGILVRIIDYVEKYRENPDDYPEDYRIIDSE